MSIPSIASLKRKPSEPLFYLLNIENMDDFAIHHIISIALLFFFNKKSKWIVLLKLERKHTTVIKAK